MVRCTKTSVDGVDVYFTSDRVPDGLYTDYKLETIARFLLKNIGSLDTQKEAIVFHPGGVSVGIVAGHDVEIIDPPNLMDYTTGAFIRHATKDELAASIEAGRHDGGSGVIEVDGVKCYVIE